MRKYARRHVYKMPPLSCLDPQDPAANVAFFLLENTGSIEANWRGNILAADQRLIFGRYFGKGTITIFDFGGRIRHTVKRCFGLDFECTHDVTVVQLVRQANAA